MAQSTTSWRNGASGNPKGRPPMRTRPLATVLREVGAEEVSERENRTAVATLIWRALRTGNLELESGKRLALNAKEWLDLVRWVHLHIDGRLESKEQSAEARDQQSQLEELFDQEEPAPAETEPSPQSVASTPSPEPVLHTLS
jgi:hypothetical protein